MRTTALLLAGLTAASFGATAGAAPQATTGTSTAGKAKATASTAGLAAHDRQFLMTLAKDNAAEIDLGRLVQDKGQSGDVKSFAKQMVDDHGKAGDELKDLASKKGVTVSDAPKPEAKTLHSRLDRLSGDAVDKAYIQAMVKDHKEAVALLKQEAKTGQDPDVRAFAEKTLPTIEHHLEQAQQLAGSRPAGTGK